MGKGVTDPVEVEAPDPRRLGPVFERSVQTRARESAF